jgi:dipeptidyl aminopeptidase/acylaminoacyl peptidase
MATTVHPYGSWPSPLSAERIVERAASVGEVVVGLDDVWWSELRPSEGGRVAIVRHRSDGEQVDVLPEGWSARTRVHEYGGGAWWLHDDAVFFANGADQRLYRLDAGTQPRPLTAEPTVPAGDRYADGRSTVDGRWVVCVRERHHADGSEPTNELVAVDAHDGGEPIVLATGADFYSSPRPSPDGRRLCWVQWDHPDMPWDGTELWVADLVDGPERIEVGGARRVAGGADEAISQPTWTAQGDLVVLSDRSGWWTLHRLAAAQIDGAPGTATELTPLAPVEGDIGVPPWVFGQSRYAVLADGRILCAVSQGGIDRLAVIDTAGQQLRFLETPYTALSGIEAYGDGATLLGGSPRREPEVAVLDLPADGQPLIVPIRTGRDLGLDEAWFSVPEAISFPTSGGALAHALLYRPTNPTATGPEGELPPLVVLSHGGPTSAARPQLNLTTQYWTSRGIAVVDVNYRGSSGFGRTYRRALDGGWGILDVDDCIAAAEHVVGLGLADPDRLAIRGGSAGGFTTLAALTFHDRFRVGASLYGIADLEALVRDTHKFEARYLDGLVGPYPTDQATYQARSPIHHTDLLSAPLIVFQGAEDAVVPPAQAELMVAALRAKGIPHAYLLFEGEQHGFRQADHVRQVLEAELSFYAQVLGFELADPVPAVAIQRG